MLGTILLLIGWIGPEPLVVTDTVDVCELSHVYDAEGRENFTQLVWWRWNGERLEVQAWKIVRDDMRVEANRVSWYDGGVRQVRARQFKESWLQWDVELADRELLSSEFRRGLSPQSPRR